jgi:hypothetical protein
VGKEAKGGTETMKRIRGFVAQGRNRASRKKPASLIPKQGGQAMSRVLVTLLVRRKRADVPFPFALQQCYTTDDGVEHVQARELDGAGHYGNSYRGFSPHLWRAATQEELVEFLLTHSTPDLWFVDPKHVGDPNVYGYPKAGDRATNNGQQGWDVNGLAQRYDDETNLRRQFDALSDQFDTASEAERARREKEWGEKYLR